MTIFFLEVKHIIQMDPFVYYGNTTKEPMNYYGAFMLDIENPELHKDLLENNGAKWDTALQLWYVENEKNELLKQFPVKHPVKIDQEYFIKYCPRYFVADIKARLPEIEAKRIFTQASLRKYIKKQGAIYDPQYRLWYVNNPESEICKIFKMFSLMEVEELRRPDYL